MCGSMADIQSATAEIRREKRKKEEETNHREKYNVLPYYNVHRAAITKIITLDKRIGSTIPFEYTHPESPRLPEKCRPTRADFD